MDLTRSKYWVHGVTKGGLGGTVKIIYVSAKVMSLLFTLGHVKRAAALR